MKQRRKVKEKLNTIVQSNYVVLDIVNYNELFYQNINYHNKINSLYSIIYSDNNTDYKYKEIVKILRGE